MTTTLYQRHVQEWSNCNRCSLCKGRKNVVLARGTIPCDVLFVGEAPGESEDVVGVPFVGPAGKLQDAIISRSVPKGVAIAFANIIACIPRDEVWNKIKEPPEDAIEACAPRLDDLFRIACPQVIVCVGTVAERWLRKPAYKGYTWLALNDVKIISIIHPAAILRANVAQRGLIIQRASVTIANAVENLIPF